MFSQKQMEAYALGYFYGRAHGNDDDGYNEFESNASLRDHRHEYRAGYDRGVADWCVLDDTTATTDPAADVELPGKAPEPKPEVRLSGTDGNAFAILGAVSRALRRAGCSEQHIDTFMEEATSGDYDHLLVTCHKYADVH